MDRTISKSFLSSNGIELDDREAFIMKSQLELAIFTN
jgi:hypothetical protein